MKEGGPEPLASLSNHGFDLFQISLRVAKLSCQREAGRDPTFGSNWMHAILNPARAYLPEYDGPASVTPMTCCRERTGGEGDKRKRRV